MAPHDEGDADLREDEEICPLSDAAQTSAGQHDDGYPGVTQLADDVHVADEEAGASVAESAPVEHESAGLPDAQDGIAESTVVAEPMAKEEIKDIEGSLGRIHMVLAWLHTLFVLYKPGADKAGAIIEGRDESPDSFRIIKGQSKQPRLRFQCMYCPLTKLLRSFNNGGPMSFLIDVSKNLGKPFGLSNPLKLRETTDNKACGDHNGCLMHRLFKTVIGGVHSLSQEDLKSLCSKVTLPDKTKIPKIERLLKRLEEAHLDSLKSLRGLTVEEEAHLDSLKSLRGLTVAAGGVDNGAAGAEDGGDNVTDVASFLNDDNDAAVAGVRVEDGQPSAGGVLSFQDGQSSAGGVLNLLNFLHSLSPENLKLIEMHLTTEAADMLRKLQAILTVPAEAGAAGNRSAKGVGPLVRSGGGPVQGQDEEENGVFKVLEDLHAWPKQVVEVSQLMGALSLSAHERARDESVVFPLVVVRVLQVSYCHFKSMCCICP